MSLFHIILRHSSLLSLLITAGAPARADQPAGIHWPSFRGPEAIGVDDAHAVPVTWDVATGENVRWKTPIPGLGHSSPIVWGDRIYLATAVSERDAEFAIGLDQGIAPLDERFAHHWLLVCIDKRNGKPLWETQGCRGVPRIQRHPKATHANSTPATDGRHIVTFFGSEGLFCFDAAGDLLWKVDLGLLDASFFEVPDAQWGFGSSPVIHDGKVFVQCDAMNESFVAAFDVETGDEIWRTARDELPTWSTPTLHAAGGKTRLIVNGYRHIGGYDAATGAEIWKLHGGGDIPVPTPVIAHGLAFICSSHGGHSPMYAVRLEARGDISLDEGESANEFMAWSVPDNRAYLQTPLVYGDFLYSCRGNGVLKCYRATTGELIYENRLGEGRDSFTASPVASRGHLYFPAEDGDVYVVKAGPEFEVVAVNPLGEPTLSTPALSEGMLIVRTRQHLFAIGDVGPHID